MDAKPQKKKNTILFPFTTIEATPRQTKEKLEERK